MINLFVNAITKPGFQNLVQNTTAQVSIETGLKAAGRPAFTLADKNVDKETRKYSAVKELLYQTLCLGIYLAIIPPIFKRGGFNIFKKICRTLDKNPEFLAKISDSAKDPKLAIDRCSIDMFKNEKALSAIHQLGQMKPAERCDVTNEKAVKLLKTLKDNLVENHKDNEAVLKKVMEEEKDGKFFRQFFIAKGGLEMSSIVGSVVGLTLLAPELSHLVLHPIMKGLNMEAPKAKDYHLKDKEVNDQTQKLDKKA